MSKQQPEPSLKLETEGRVLTASKGARGDRGATTIKVEDGDYGFLRKVMNPSTQSIGSVKSGELNPSIKDTLIS